MTGPGTLPGDVIINVLGNSFSVNGSSQVTGLVRAPNATVSLKGNNAVVRGQVIADYLDISGGKIIGDTSFTDTTPPAVAITSPADNSTTASTSITVSGTASDDGGVAAVYVNSVPAALDAATGRWSISNVALSIGANTLTARAVDRGGNQSSAQITVTRQPPADTQQPQVAITSPANNSTTTDALVNVRGTASDAGQYQSGVSAVTVNGVAAAYDAATGQWSVSNVPLALGANTLTARAVDGAGNQATASVNVTRQQAPDTTPPSLTVTSPADGSTTEATSVNVSGTATDTGANASGVAQVTVNGEAASLDASGAWTLPNFALSLGQNSITVRATDRAGNPTTKVVSVTRVQSPDTAPPSLTVSEPADNSTTHAEAVTVSGTATDAGANASGVAQVTVNGTPAQLDPQTGAWTLAGVALALGANTIAVRATDRAGNDAARDVHVTRVLPPDTTPPTLAINTPLDNSTTIDAAVVVTGTASDTGVNASGVASVTVNDRPAVYNAATGTWSIAGVALALGANAVTAVALDNAGNRTTTRITVTREEPPRDTTPPALSITTPAEGLTTQAETINVSGTVEDPAPYASGVAAVTVNGVEAARDVTAGTWTVAALPLALGANVITARAADAAGNVTTKTVNVTREPVVPPDTQAPVVQITSPFDGETLYDSPITVTGTAVDQGTNATGVSRVVVNGVNADFNPGTNTWTATGVSLAEGSNVISVEVEDSATPAPNKGTAQITVTRRNVEPPALTITNPEPGATLGLPAVTVAGQVTPGAPGVGVTVTVNGEPAQVAGGQYTKSVTLAEGTNTISVVATDARGQTAQASVTVISDRTPPTVALSTLPSVLQPGVSYNVRADAADNIGVASVEFSVNGQKQVALAAAPYEFTLAVPADAAPDQV